MEEEMNLIHMDQPKELIIHMGHHQEIILMDPQIIILFHLVTIIIIHMVAIIIIHMVAIIIIHME